MHHNGMAGHLGWTAMWGRERAKFPELQNFTRQILTAKQTTFDRASRHHRPPIAFRTPRNTLFIGRPVLQMSSAAWTPVANVARWSFLGLGIFTGFYHQRSLTAAQKAEASHREYERKQELINKAKEEFARSKQPATSGGLNQDPSDPKFDLEAYLNALAKEHP